MTKEGLAEVSGLIHDEIERRQQRIERLVSVMNEHLGGGYVFDTEGAISRSIMSWITSWYFGKVPSTKVLLSTAFGSLAMMRFSWKLTTTSWSDSVKQRSSKVIVLISV